MSEWVEAPLAQLATFQKGRKVDTSPFDGDGYAPYLGASGLEGGDDGYAFTRLAVIAKSTDTLMLWDGERSGLVGYGRQGVVASTVSKLSPSDRVEPKYLYYALSERFDWIQHRRTGTGVPHVPKDLGRLLKLRYPKHRMVQRRIANILSSIDTAIEKTEALIAKYQQIKAGLMRDLFTRGVLPSGELRPPREQAPELYQETAIGWIPREWRIDPLGKCLKAPPKNGYSPREVNTWQGLYVLGLGCLTHDGFEAKQLKNAPRDAAIVSGALLAEGDFLISRANTPELVGLCGTFRDIGSPVIYPDLMMRLKLVDSLDAGFLEAQLLMPATRKRLTALAVGTSSSMAKLNAKSVQQLLIAVPHPVEQRAIVGKLSKVTDCIKAYRSARLKLYVQKQGLMHDLLTGNVSIKVEEPEVVDG
ncbi:restriction endonuclease subunit S [Burkholderia sp. AW49-1]